MVRIWFDADVSQAERRNFAAKRRSERLEVKKLRQNTGLSILLNMPETIENFPCIVADKSLCGGRLVVMRVPGE